MRTALASVNALSGALFLFGAAQHAGIAFGRIHEPRILPAAAVEILCAILLLWSAAALLRDAASAQRATLIAGLVALGGIALGMISLAVGAGPRTRSNDLYHAAMLVLVGVSFALLFSLQRSRAR